jgi:hypothetical protein
MKYAGKMGAGAGGVPLSKERLEQLNSELFCSALSAADRERSKIERVTRLDMTMVRAVTENP